MSGRGFVKLQRGEATDELIRNKNAMHLLTVIALRARFSATASLSGLTFGQAMIGDFDQYDMTEKEYRCAKKRLERFGLVTFLASNHGTIATLSDSRIFCLTDERDDPELGGHKGEQSGGLFSEVGLHKTAGTRAGASAGNGRTRGGLRATNQNGKNEKKEHTTAALRAPGASDGRGETTQTKQAAEKSPRPADPCFTALARVEAADLDQLTASGAKTIAVALAGIRKALPSVTPEDIQRRADRYGRIMPAGTRLTAHALAKHWARCGDVGLGSHGSVDRIGRRIEAVEREPEGWREFVNETAPGTLYARGGDQEGAAWASIESAHRRYIIEQLAKHRRTAA